MYSPPVRAIASCSSHLKGIQRYQRAIRGRVRDRPYAIVTLYPYTLLCILSDANEDKAPEEISERYLCYAGDFIARSLGHDERKKKEHARTAMVRGVSPSKGTNCVQDEACARAARYDPALPRGTRDRGTQTKKGGRTSKNRVDQPRGRREKGETARISALISRVFPNNAHANQGIRIILEVAPAGSAGLDGGSEGGGRVRARRADKFIIARRPIKPDGNGIQ